MIGLFPISTQDKEAYWAFLTGQDFKNYRAVGCTKRRLDRIKAEMLEDGEFWDDVLARHGLRNPDGSVVPTEHARKTAGSHHWDHMLGNFYGMISQSMHEKGWLK